MEADAYRFVHDHYEEIMRAHHLRMQFLDELMCRCIEKLNKTRSTSEEITGELVKWGKNPDDWEKTLLFKSVNWHGASIALAPLAGLGCGSLIGMEIPRHLQSGGIVALRSQFNMSSNATWVDVVKNIQSIDLAIDELVRAVGLLEKALEQSSD